MQSIHPRLAIIGSLGWRQRGKVKHSTSTSPATHWTGCHPKQGFQNRNTTQTKTQCLRMPFQSLSWQRQLDIKYDGRSYETGNRLCKSEKVPCMNIFQVFEKGGTVTTVSNFPAFERSLNDFFPGQVTRSPNFPGKKIILKSFLSQYSLSSSI